MTMITNNATNNNTNKEEIIMTLTKDLLREELKKHGVELSNTVFKKTKRNDLIKMLKDKQSDAITVPAGDMSSDKYYPEDNTKHYSTEVNTDDEAYWKSLTHRNISNKDLQWQAIMASTSNNVVTEENMVATIMKKLLRKGVIYEATKLHAPLDRLNNKKFGTVKLKVLRAIVFKVYNNCHTEKATEAEVDAVLDYMVQNHIIARDYFDSATGKVPQYLIPNATWDKYGVKNFIKA